MKKIKKILLYFFLFMILIIIGGIVFIFTTDNGYNLRVFAAETVISTQHRHWAKYTFLPEEKLEELTKAIDAPKYINNNHEDIKAIANQIKNNNEDADIFQLTLQKLTESDFKIESEKKKKLLIEVETIEKQISPTYYYKGKIMYISNPHYVELVSSEKRNFGEQIHVLAERVNAIGAINASGFYDPNGKGNGGTPLGIIIQDGQILNSSNNDPDRADFIAGITYDGVLISGVYSANQLIELGVRDAAGFKPQLISNGKKMITKGDGGWGIGPRTAIAQRADGTIMFLVIEGRQAHSIGATQREVQDILYDRGAINAMAMDGGSSSIMYFNKETITIPSSFRNISRYLPNAWVVTNHDNVDIVVYEDGQPVELK